MSGLTPLVDTLLASRLAQRPDLVPLKPEVQVAGPGPVTRVEEVINDVRLPSRAAVEQQLGVGPLKSGLRGQGDLAMAQPDQAVTLSTAARTLSAILEGQDGVASRVTGISPLMASSQALSSPVVMAATLAHTVRHSGLFYESHLAQFAAGARSLAELQQEPQAHLQSNDKAGPLSTPWPGAEGSATKSHDVMGMANSRVAQPVAASAVETAPQGSGQEGASALLARAEAAAFRHAISPQSGHSHKNSYPYIQDADGSMPASHAATDDSTPNPVRSNTPLLAGIHPDSLALVRQQFEILAQPAFRWSGQAWPDVPMDWDIQEEMHEPADGGKTGAQRTWNTRLDLTLPALGRLEVRISLASQTLTLRLSAAEDTACTQLRQGASDLSPRLWNLGLDVTSLQIVTEIAQPSSSTSDDVPDARAA